MKKVLRAIQFTGFAALMVGMSGYDSAPAQSVLMIIGGLAVMIGFVAIENSYCFVETKKDFCHRPKLQKSQITR